MYCIVLLHVGSAFSIYTHLITIEGHFKINENPYKCRLAAIIHAKRPITDQYTKSMAMIDVLQL